MVFWNQDIVLVVCGVGGGSGEPGSGAVREVVGDGEKMGERMYSGACQT